MPNPFPGMNPYLENPQFWKPIHSRLIAALDAAIREQLPPAFVTTLEERVYLSLTEIAYPDVAVVRTEPVSAPIPVPGANVLTADPPLTLALSEEEIAETFLEIRLPGSPDKIIASLEVLSPKNKSRESRGRDAYLAKQAQLLRSETHLLEVDLLRGGTYSLAAPQDEVAAAHPLPWQYGVCLHRARTGNRYDVWVASVRERLPRFAVPLTPEYADIVVDLNRVVTQVYDDGRFDRRIDYRQEPMPPLAPTDADWADVLLKSHGLR